VAGSDHDGTVILVLCWQEAHRQGFRQADENDLRVLDKVQWC
jgi:hypothetical protein